MPRSNGYSQWLICAGALGATWLIGCSGPATQTHNPDLATRDARSVDAPAPGDLQQIPSLDLSYTPADLSACFCRDDSDCRPSILAYCLGSSDGGGGDGGCGTCVECRSSADCPAGFSCNGVNLCVPIPDAAVPHDFAGCSALLIGSFPACPCLPPKNGDACTDTTFCGYPPNWYCACASTDAGSMRWQCVALTQPDAAAHD